jgi:peptidoglycan/xylan/chitin deacetylase (PgdA/CDA1 family)
MKNEVQYPWRDDTMERASDTGSTRPIFEPKSQKAMFYLCCKRLSFNLCKWIGLFRLARRMTRNGLRILCYHGFSMIDESRFSPRTFIEPGTFKKRMLFIRHKGFPVLSLEEALKAFDNGTLPPNAVVITIDDGFFSTYKLAWPILRELSMPAIVYVTTYYAIKQTPIFRLAVQYMFWKTTAQSLDTTGLGFSETGVIPVATMEQKRSALLAAIRHGESQCNNEKREWLANLLGERLGVDYRAIVNSRIFNVMSPEEIIDLARGGIGIELHSHRHNLPLDHSGARREIEENRVILERLTGSSLIHFCYPSGFYRLEQLPWLAESGIFSAVTGESGLNYPHTPKLRLKRFVDGEDVSFIEFEGEVMGFAELARRVFAGIKGIAGQNG